MKLSSLGLQRTPFQRGIPTDHLFRSQQIEEGLARLLYVADKRSIAVITGGVGTGKSTLIRLFQEQLDPTDFMFLYIADSNLTPRGFFTYALDFLGRENPFQMAKAKRAFQKTVLELYEDKGITCVFAIDEVQSMTFSMMHELIFLTNFGVDSYSPLSIILAGQKEMLAQMKTMMFSPLRRRIETFFELKGMEEKETRAYIEHHLHQAGCKRPLFPEDIISSIHEHSKGVPAIINRLCNNCLFDVSSEQKKLVDRESFTRSIAELF